MSHEAESWVSRDSSPRSSPCKSRTQPTSGWITRGVAGHCSTSVSTASMRHARSFGRNPSRFRPLRRPVGTRASREVPEAVACALDFGRGRVGSFICSFGAGDTAAFQFVGTKGSLHMEAAYEYTTPPSFEMRVGERRTKHRFKKSDQFAPELLYFSECVIRNRNPEPSGYEGLADVAVIEALHKAMVSGRKVPVMSARQRLRRPSLEQERRR